MVQTSSITMLNLVGLELRAPSGEEKVGCFFTGKNERSAYAGISVTQVKIFWFFASLRRYVAPIASTFGVLLAKFVQKWIYEFFYVDCPLSWICFTAALDHPRNFVGIGTEDAFFMLCEFGLKMPIQAPSGAFGDKK